MVAFTLGLVALTGVVALDELLDGRGQAGRVWRRSTRWCVLGDSVTRQHTRNVVVDDSLDAGRRDDYMVDSPDATVLGVGRWEK